jgi:RNA polymerase primary sigma factor
LDLLTKEEVAGLGKKGDQDSLDELVSRNLKYVVSVANRYKGCGLSLGDLINEGNIGLIQAAHRFDHTKNVKFITYAIWWIRQSIIHALASQSGTVKLPIKQAGVLYKLGVTYKSFFQKHQREPSTQELAKLLNLKEEIIVAIMMVYRSTLSLDSHIKNSDETSYLDLLADPMPHAIDDEVNKISLEKEVAEIMEELSPREQEILKMRFGFGADPMTLEEIGVKISLSRERVRQIEKKAKNKLLQKANSRSLRDFLS